LPSLRLASYNVHRAIGRDRRTMPRRILEVLREIDADVIALQEVEASETGVDMLAWLAAETGFHAVAGTTLIRHDGHFGNGLLSRCPIRNTQLCDLSWRGREPRGAIAADIVCNGSGLRVVATHLGLRPAERRAQVYQLLQLFSWKPEDRAVLLGDLNEWFLWGRPLRRLHRYFKRTAAPPTFPATFPVHALDRVWAHPRSMLRRVHVHKSRCARIASDHLPIVATLEL
jgi:endonuclease/exonuclease/phosphatase family metal-dependent hydrolase